MKKIIGVVVVASMTTLLFSEKLTEDVIVKKPKSPIIVKQTVTIKKSRQKIIVHKKSQSQLILETLLEKSKSSRISYEVLVGIARTESKMNPKAISETNDYGLMQINSRTGKWISGKLKKANYDLLDYKTNIDFSLFYLEQNLSQLEKEYPSKKGSLFLENMLIMSYNRGVSGAKSYYAQHGEFSEYVKAVREQMLQESLTNI